MVDGLTFLVALLLPIATTDVAVAIKKPATHSTDNTLLALAMEQIKAATLRFRSKWQTIGMAESNSDKVYCTLVGYSTVLLLALIWYTREKHAEPPYSRTLRRILRQQGVILKVNLCLILLPSP